MIDSNGSGFSGSIVLGELQPFLYHVQPPPPISGGSQTGVVMQWTRPGVGAPPLPVPRAEVLLLTGTLFAATPREDVLSALQHVFASERYEDIGRLLQGDVAGCWVSARRVVFFKTRTSNASIFFRREGHRLSWSTDPTDLAGAGPLDIDALYSCCRGDDAFVYRGLNWVPAGRVVVVTESAARTACMERGAPAPEPARHFALQDWAAAARAAMLEATRALAAAGERVGVLISGGIDSSAIASALVENGGDVVGYHFRFAHPAANEAGFAGEVCAALRIPLRCVEATSGRDYLSTQWHFAHPYGHPGYRWFEQVAQRMQADGVRLLATGRFGDATFGPLERYGLFDILTGPIPWRDRGRMAFHLLSTDWTLPDVAGSILPRHSLIDTTSLSRAQRRNAPTRKADFLAPAAHFPTAAQLRYSDFAGERGLDFSPQDLAIEQIWRGHDIRVFHPYAYAPVQSLAAQLPQAYRILPFQGQKVTKPVLRLAYAGILPPSVLRRVVGSWLNVPGQEFCLSRLPWLADLLGSAEARVVQLGIVDPLRLQRVFRHPQEVRAHAHTLLATAMVELFLRQRDQREPEPVSPQGKAGQG